jgi:hypothetical protein
MPRGLGVRGFAHDRHLLEMFFYKGLFKQTLGNRPPTLELYFRWLLLLPILRGKRKSFRGDKPMCLSWRIENDRAVC